MSNTAIILDSSVIAKWFFTEENSKLALRIKNDFSEGLISIAAPLLLYYEINNLLKTAVKSFRVDPHEALGVYNAFLELDIILYSSEELMRHTLKIAIDRDLSSYDASYVALADHLNMPFYTSDTRLIKKADNKLVLNLMDYYPIQGQVLSQDTGLI